MTFCTHYYVNERVLCRFLLSRRMYDDFVCVPQQKIIDYANSLGINENILIRKKWLSELYAYVLADETPVLSPGLKGWRYDWLIQHLVPILQNVIAEGDEKEIKPNKLSNLNPPI